MKASELFHMEPLSTTMNLSFLVGCYYNHVPEVLDYPMEIGNDGLEWERNTAVMARTVAEKNVGHRVWRMDAIVMDGEPVMVTQNAGRDGDDFFRRFIVNPGKYAEMVGYLGSLVPIKFGTEFETVLLDADEERADLDNFYGYSLQNYMRDYHG